MVGDGVAEDSVGVGVVGDGVGFPMAVNIKIYINFI